jgi:hypothetical protein
VKRFFRISAVVLSAAVLSAAAGACALIDERQKDCPEEMSLTCSVKLVSNKDEEMNDKLGTLHDLPLRAALEDYLSDVFIDDAHDVEMLFYDQRRRGKMTFRESEVMDAEQKVFSLQVPASDYRVAAVANLSAVPMLSLQNEDDGYALALVHKSTKGTVPSHPSAVYAARQRMLVRDREEQQFDIQFHMANAAAVVALNCDSCEVKNLRATFSGLADSFRILDSAYSFDQHIEMEADIIDARPYVDNSEEADRFLYDIFWERWTKLPLMVCAVGFPSPSVGSAVIGTYPIIWTINLYATLADGTVTRNEIYIGKPLESSQLMIVKGWLTANGSFMNTPPHPPYIPGPDVDPDQPVDSTVVGVTVMLNWTDGLDQKTNL